MKWRFWQRKPKLTPDLNKFNNELIHSVYGRMYDDRDVAADFRHAINSEPARGRRVLFTLLTWCGEYSGPPEDDAALQRWAGKQEIAALIKAAMFADLSIEEENPNHDRHPD